MSEESDDRTEQTEHAAMRALFFFTLTLVVAGLVYFIALGLLHR